LPTLIAKDDEPVLVHGDLGGRPRGRRTGAVDIAGVLDWESAGSGAPLWHVGSLFRYSRRYAPAFRDRFVRGYRSTGSRPCPAPPDRRTGRARRPLAGRLRPYLARLRLRPSSMLPLPRGAGERAGVREHPPAPPR
jgi:hypothetical protein